jgi:hypothetical protein
MQNKAIKGHKNHIFLLCFLLFYLSKIQIYFVNFALIIEFLKYIAEISI